MLNSGNPPVGEQPRFRIGELLVNKNIISQPQLDAALIEQKDSHLKLGKFLIHKGLIKESDLSLLLSEQLKIEYVDLSLYQYNPDDVMKLPENISRSKRAIVLREDESSFLVGFADPMDIFAFDEVSQHLSGISNKDVIMASVPESQLIHVIDTVYTGDQFRSLADEVTDSLTDATVNINTIQAQSDDEVPIVRMLKQIFEDAVRHGASDIHIEPGEKCLRIRQRIDGVLRETKIDNPKVAQALVLKLKLLASLNISEKRRPQDGRFHMAVANKALDVRLSTMPIQHGESVVMRLLDQSSGIMGLDNSGMPASILSRFRSLIHKPYGLILVTGPTGSGKTTTLYGALSELNTPEKKIITAEDPVEYRIDGINQVQIDHKIDLDFAVVLKSILRQDPDIALVGEIRDKESAKISLKASMTGHLVLSTLHTNDAVSSAMRLIDLGVEPFLISSSLKAIMAQRLIRKLCTHCCVPLKENNETLQTLRNGTGQHFETNGFYEHVGCTQCHNTGYKGRIGVFELLEITEPLADALRLGDESLFVKRAREAEGFFTLAENALQYAREGITSLDEVVRIANDVESLKIAPKATPEIRHEQEAGQSMPPQGHAEADRKADHLPSSAAGHPPIELEDEALLGNIEDLVGEVQDNQLKNSFGDNESSSDSVTFDLE
ncbi:GspE/PulE family protein [Neptuniibacter sp. QD37_11]|uniref:GspE/PulE family protein n=1 Tax=Neptuniibacter sp. QD37_11 TaxID=3398209 RepID=UPI0039F4AA20